MNRRPESQIVAPGASPEETAAVVAAVEQFVRDHAPAAVEEEPRMSPWKAAALREGMRGELHFPIFGS